MYFVCKYVGGVLSIDGFDENERKNAELAEWIPLEELNSLDLASTVDYRKFVREAMRF